MRDATVLRGHAVRANYLAAGRGRRRGRDRRRRTCSTRWPRSGERPSPGAPTSPAGRARSHQDEAFGDDCVLPPDRAYSETCAGIGSVMFAGGCCSPSGDCRGTPTSSSGRSSTSSRRRPSHDGHARSTTPTPCTSGCPARSRRPGRRESPRAPSSLRAPWFEVSCCPPNVARTLASLGGVRRHRRRRRRPAAPVRAVAHPRRRWPTAGGSASRSRPTTRATGWSACACATTAGPAVDADACGCPRGPTARELGTRGRRAARPRPGHGRRCTGAFPRGDVVELRPADGAALHRRRPAHRRGPRLRRGGARPGGAGPGVGRPRRPAADVSGGRLDLAPARGRSTGACGSPSSRGAGRRRLAVRLRAGAGGPPTRESR